MSGLNQAPWSPYDSRVPHQSPFQREVVLCLVRGPKVPGLIVTPPKRAHRLRCGWGDTWHLPHVCTQRRSMCFGHIPDTTPTVITGRFTPCKDKLETPIFWIQQTLKNIYDVLENMENTKISNIGFVPLRGLKFGRERYVDRETCRQHTEVQYVKGCGTRVVQGIDPGNGSFQNKKNFF